MKVTSLKWINIGSYGNNWQELKFEDKGSLNLIVGKNGHGKCVHPDTEIDILFEDPELEKKFLEFIKK
jgi:hypothetical protein